MGPISTDPSLSPRGGGLRLIRWGISLLSLALAVASSRAALAPKNPHGSFKEECGLCHGAQSWTPARISRKFNHAKYGFPLEGAHAGANCLSCHRTLEFKAPDHACVSCHEDVHRGEMGTECARCHGARSFIDHAQMVRVHEMTRFPLSGAHAGLECEACHAPVAQGHLQYVNQSVDCYGCHAAAFAATTSPNHQTGGFSHDCRSCHGSTSWRPARFNHDNTGFPLTGSHKTVACQTCHTGGVFTGLSPDCVSCHRANYDATTNPNHSGASFPLQCASCHNTTSWAGAQFNHDTPFFPIYSGRHLGQWTSCTDCHTDPTHYTTFTCLQCHAHSNQAQVDASHQGRSGYRYDSAACYSCHPRGTAG